MEKLNRNNMIYFNVLQVTRDEVKYHVEIFGDGRNFKAYVGLSEDDPNLTAGGISRTKRTAIELAIITYTELNKPLH